MAKEELPVMYMTTFGTHCIYLLMCTVTVDGALITVMLIKCNNV